MAIHALGSATPPRVAPDWDWGNRDEKIGDYGRLCAGGLDQGSGAETSRRDANRGDDNDGDKGSVSISVPEDQNALLAEFTMSAARQMDVIEKIRRAFSLNMEDYGTQTIWFPKGDKTPDKSA